MHDQKEYLTIKELYAKAISEKYDIQFIKDIRRANIWCKADDYFHCVSIVKWSDRPYLTQYYIALKCYGLHLGQCYILMTEKHWQHSIRNAKEFNSNQYHTINKNNPYIHITLKRITCKQYQIKVIESFKSEQEYAAKLNEEKQIDLW